MLVQIPANTAEDLFVHKSQTDQLLVVKGQLVLVTFINKQYQYIPLSEKYPAVVTIPPGVLHGAINTSSEPCVIVNAVLRHREPQKTRLRYPWKTFSLRSRSSRSRVE